MNSDVGMGQPLLSSYPDQPDVDAAAATMAEEPSAQPAYGADDARRMALQLAERRKAIDDEIAAHGEVLKSNDATLTSALIDADGFPSSTIDIVAVRTARSRIIALRNDRAAIEREMRDLLGVALARPAGQYDDASAAQTNGTGTADGLTSAAMAHVPGTNGALSMSVPVRHGDQAAWSDVGALSPFARVNSVAQNGPAAQADVRAGDEVLQFGHLTAATAHRSATQRDLANLPSAVSEGAAINIVVVRRESGASAVKRLRITPASGWGGRGLLGCHLIPL